MPAGRKPKYTQKDREAVIARIAEGESLRAVCRDEGTPSVPQFLKWVSEDAALAEQYARAMEQRADAVFDELLEIADDGTNDWMERNGEDDEGWKLNGEHVQRSKLRVDARKWALARMSPKKYGDRQEIHNKHDLSDPIASMLGEIASNGSRVGKG